MNKGLTIKDIAKAAGVSETTISRYLNKKYEYMSEKTRRKIEEVVLTLDYRPSNVARSLKSQKSKLIGAVIADIGNQFASDIIKGLSDTCEALGYTLMIAISDESTENEQIQIEKFLDNQVEGLIINTTGFNQDYLTQLREGSVPVVLLDRGVPESQIDVVTNDNYGIGLKAMKYLIDSGFKSIGFFVNEVTNTVRSERLRAFKNGLAGQTEVLGDVYVVDPDNHENLIESMMSFKKLPEPRAIFSANGLTALGLLEAMKEEQLQIIEDFGLLTFDESTWARVVSPSITTIDQSSYGLGVEACRLLVHKVEGTAEKQSLSTSGSQLPSRLIIRESTSYLN
ncbi:LacI family DNA-binding transcriptional regulator [Vagococcus sp. BWB3-3]|uniref:LacI family DNA-binding transcriptional regulator n=1 Tax=Vagococcus allomyrinae TaxID=2794353 RepID=A0A940SVG3_9ENTE|nr:LacI family DNA-binding transcriptional regulator [Vagococcus allomyrinae]MBP1041819.1 LacI family DNA-binding transcriptional regulator [Vagococcus allomyrinae]